MASLLPVLYGVECENRCQLFIGERVTVANAVLSTDQNLCSLRNADPCRLCDYLRGTSNKLCVHCMTSVLEQQTANLLGLLTGHEVCSLTLKLCDNLVVVALLTDDRLLGSTDRTVIKGLARR